MDPFQQPQSQSQPQPQAQPSGYAPQPVAAPAPAPMPIVPAGVLGASAPLAAPAPKAAGSKKGLIFGIIGGVLGFIVIAGIAAFALLGGGVTHADYEAAYDAASAVRDDYANMDDAVLSISSTGAGTEDAVDKIQKGAAKFDADYKKLSDLKAVKNDKEINAVYKKLDAKKAKFDKGIVASVEALGKLAPLTHEVNSALSSTDPVARIKAVRANVRDVTGLQDENNKTFVSKLGTTLAKLEGLAAKVQAGREDYRKYDSKAVSDYYDTVSELSTSIRDWQSGLSKLADDADLADEINNLGETITAKVNGEQGGRPTSTGATGSRDI